MSINLYWSSLPYFFIKCNFFFFDLYHAVYRQRVIRAKRGRRPSGARNLVGKKKSEQKKKGTTTTTNFVPGQTIHFLVEVFAFLSLLQPSQTFSYVFHFHNLSKRHSEKSFSEKKKKKLKKLFIFFSNFFSIFFLSPKSTQHLFLFILL